MPLILSGASYPDRRTFPIDKPSAFLAAANADPEGYEAKLAADFDGTRTITGIIPHELNSELFPDSVVPEFYVDP